MTTILGIDIAKASFNTCLLRPGQPPEHGSFTNDPDGFRKLLRFLKKRRVTDLQAGMEATGRYGEDLALWLHQQGYSVSVINPARIKAYGESQLRRAKTDPLDAALIADFCRTQQPLPWTPPAPEWWELRQLVRHLADLQGDRQRQRNRLQAGPLPAAVRGHLEQQTDLLDAQIAEVKQQIEDHLDQHPDLKRQKDLLNTIPGLGALTIGKLLAEFRDITSFSKKELIAFCGLNPSQQQSGSSRRGATAISKLGPRTIRVALYMPAINAKRFNPVLRAFAERMRDHGLRPQQVVIAVMRKLLHLVYGVLKSGRPFDPAIHDAHAAHAFA